MRAAIFERQGLDNLNVKEDVQQPTITDHDVLIKVKAAGVNPMDYFTVSNRPGIKPLPHIPRVEVTGIIEKVGNHVATREFVLLVSKKINVETYLAHLSLLCKSWDVSCSES